jgi:phage regulator Rha-like protein
LDKQGKTKPMYEITRDGFTFLAMGFTGKRAAEFKEKYIAMFNAMVDRMNKKSRLQCRGKCSLPLTLQKKRFVGSEGRGKN